jgi:hypothetical protein
MPNAWDGEVPIAARDPANNPVHPLDPLACKWSLYGHVLRRVKNTAVAADVIGTFAVVTGSLMGNDRLDLFAWERELHRSPADLIDLCTNVTGSAAGVGLLVWWLPLTIVAVIVGALLWMLL